MGSHFMHKYMRIGERFAKIFLLAECLLYMALFSFLSGSFEFKMLLTHKTETKMWFFDEMTSFLNTGGMSMIALGLFIMMVLCAVAYICAMKFSQNKFPVLLITYVVKAIGCVGLLPMAWFCIVNERLYSIEVMVAVIVSQILFGFASFVFTIIFIVSNRLKQKTNAG